MIPVAAIAVPPLPEELGRLPRVAIEDTIVRMIDHLDNRKPDPDLELEEDVGADDVGDISWTECQSRGSRKLEHGGERCDRHEDDEDDDVREDDDPETGIDDQPHDPDEDGL